MEIIHSHGTSSFGFDTQRTPPVLVVTDTHGTAAVLQEFACVRSSHLTPFGVGVLCAEVPESALGASAPISLTPGPSGWWVWTASTLSPSGIGLGPSNGKHGRRSISGGGSVGYFAPHSHSETQVLLSGGSIIL